MTSSLLHVPSEPVGAAQMTCEGPPETAIFLSLPSATNARDRLSGDHHGGRQFSVPGSGFAVSAFMGRTQIIVRLSESWATNASSLPSGEMRGWKSGVRDRGNGIVNAIWRS